MAEIQIIFHLPIEVQISEFKDDPENMKIVNDFLNDLFDEAQKQAKIKIENESSNNKYKLDTLGIQNGTRRIGQWSNRARTQARTFANRFFTTIRNCTNTVRNVVTIRN